MFQRNWKSPDALKYGIVSISVANIRRLSVFQSELVNQTLMGTIVQILDERDEFFYIRNRDGYTGWLSKLSVVVVEESAAEAWASSEKVLITANYGIVQEQKGETGEILTDLVPGIVLKYLETDGAYLRVELPDGRRGYLATGLVRREAEQQQVQPTVAAIEQTARNFLGIPYLWGGTSTKGFDCSGFVQTVFRLLNVELPRDASQMARVGTPIEFTDPDRLKTGDLLFFGKTLNRINHVALYLDGGRYIHARGWVRLNSLVEGDSLYDDRLKKLLVKAQRVVK